MFDASLRDGRNHADPVFRFGEPARLADYDSGMRIDPGDLEKFKSRAAALPPVVEPVLSAGDEAKLLTGRDQSDPTIHARWSRVRALMFSLSPLDGDDAALVVMLAAKRALPIVSYRERLSAYQRLVDIGELKDPPVEVLKVMRRRGIDLGDGQGLADALLPPGQDGAKFSENWPVGSGGLGTFNAPGS